MSVHGIRDRLHSTRFRLSSNRGENCVPLELPETPPLGPVHLDRQQPGLIQPTPERLRLDWEDAPAVPCRARDELINRLREEQQPVVIDDTDKLRRSRVLPDDGLPTLGIAPGARFPAPLLGIARDSPLLMLQIGALTGKAASQQAEEDLLRHFLGQALGMVGGMRQQNLARFTESGVPRLSRDCCSVDREVEEGLQAEEEMGDLARLPTMTAGHLQLGAQRLEPTRKLLSKLIKVLSEELQIAGHGPGIVET